MRSLLEAISPTAHELLSDTQPFAIGYAWDDPQFGELEGRTVQFGMDAESALASFRSLHRHITRAWIIK